MARGDPGVWTMATIGRMFGGGAETFMGAPACDDPSAVKGRAALIGAPVATSYPSVGAYCAGAPAAIRAAASAYAANRGHVNFDLGAAALPDGALADCGDLGRDAADAAGNRLRIRNAVAAVLGAGAVPVVLGGDDSVPIPVLQGFAGQPALTVLQVDAHIDWREQVEGERWGLSSTMRRASEMGHVEAIVQVGARGIGSARPEDLAAAHDWGARIVTAETLALEGLEAALAQIPAGAQVFVALDLDALDPSAMPAVIAPTAGGLGYWQVLGLIKGAAARGRIAGMTMTEFMPDHDVQGRGAALAAQLLTSACGLIGAAGDARA